MTYYKVVRVTKILNVETARITDEYSSVTIYPFFYKLTYKIHSMTFPLIENSALFAFEKLEDARNFMNNLGAINHIVLEGEGKRIEREIQRIPSPSLVTFEELKDFWNNPETSFGKNNYIRVIDRTVLLRYFIPREIVNLGD